MHGDSGRGGDFQNARDYKGPTPPGENNALSEQHDVLFLQLLNHLLWSHIFLLPLFTILHISQEHSEPANTEQIRTFSWFSQSFVQCTEMSFHWGGGGYVYPPERALLRTKGFCGASGEATARGENLYADMVTAC